MPPPAPPFVLAAATAAASTNIFAVLTESDSGLGRPSMPSERNLVTITFGGEARRNLQTSVYCKFKSTYHICIHCEDVPSKTNQRYVTKRQEGEQATFNLKNRRGKERNLKLTDVFEYEKRAAPKQVQCNWNFRLLRWLIEAGVAFTAVERTMFAIMMSDEMYGWAMPCGYYVCAIGGLTCPRPCIEPSASICEASLRAPPVLHSCRIVGF